MYYHSRRYSSVPRHVCLSLAMRVLQGALDIAALVIKVVATARYEWENVIVSLMRAWLWILIPYLLPSIVVVLGWV